MNEETAEGRDDIAARIDALFDARRDPIDDSKVVAWLGEDPATLDRFVALRAALAALPSVVAERSKRRTVLERTAVAAVALIGITLLLARTKAPSETPSSDREESRPRVLAFHQTTTTCGLDRTCVEERDRFGLLRRTETENSPALQLVRTETRSRP